MAENCPNCGAGVKSTSAGCRDWDCGSSEWANGLPVLSDLCRANAAEAKLADIKAVFADRDANLALQLSIIALEGVRDDGIMRLDIGLLLMDVVRKAAKAAGGDDDL